jgi:ribonuclease HII
MRLLGIDEAGKGPVIGSMFVAGVVFDEGKLFDLAALGVRDSKELMPAKREILAAKISKLAEDHYILEVAPQVIDELRQVMTMNEIMVRSFAAVIQRLSFDKAILDAADVNPGRFGERVQSLSGTTAAILSEHKADSTHTVVAAASILAKVARDASIRDIERSVGQRIGSGYPSDPLTIKFLKGWVKANGDLPPFTRRSWKTAERIKASFI